MPNPIEDPDAEKEKEIPPLDADDIALLKTYVRCVGGASRLESL